jgi:outer membrane protein assembly factor BamB
MKKIIAALLILPVMLACMLYSTPPSGETNFPLEQTLTISIGEDIEEVAVADNWIAVSTYQDKIIAIDIDTAKRLWTINFSVDTYSKFQIINDVLFAASQDQIIMVSKQGSHKEIALAALKETFPSPINIIKLAAIYPSYLYVIRGSNWTLEVYDITKNTLLWKVFVGRGFGNVFYDSSNHAVYVTTDDSLRTFDNSSGELLWKMKGVFAQSVFYDAGVLYISEPLDVENTFRLIAIDSTSQKKLWQKDIVRPPDFKGPNRTIFDDLIIISGYGMIAIDKTTGEQLWTSLGVGEDFHLPVEFEDVIYAMGAASSTVFAFSSSDGSLIGTANLNRDDPFGLNRYGNLHSLPDGILFSIKDTVFIYKAND